MAPIADPILRGVLFVFATLGLGLLGAAVSYFHGDYSNRENFAVFANAFAILFSVFIALPCVLFNWLPAICYTVMDGLSWIFLLIAGCATAARIHVHNCSHKWYQIKYFGGTKKGCRCTMAGIAFTFFGFAVAAALFIISLIAVIRGGAMNFGGRKKSSPRGGVPTMSQV